MKINIEKFVPFFLLNIYIEYGITIAQSDENPLAAPEWIKYVMDKVQVI
jgi:hypothetical protein